MGKHRNRKKRRTSSNRRPLHTTLDESRKSSTLGQESVGSVTDEERPTHFSPIKKKCPFFFGLYGCHFGDECGFRHCINEPDNDIEACKGLRFHDAPRYRRLKEGGLRTPFSPPPEWYEPVTIVMHVEACRINRASELCISQRAKSLCVVSHIKDHLPETGLKSVEICGPVNKAFQACREIRKIVDRDSPFFSLLHEAEYKLGSGMAKSKLKGHNKGQRWPGQSVLRMLVPTEVDIKECGEEFKANNHASLKMIKRENGSIAMVYDKEQAGSSSIAVLGILWVFDYIVNIFMKTNAGANFSAELLVEKEQACKFFETQAEVIEKQCNCVFTVHDADGVGLLRDFVLKVSGTVADLRAAFTRTICYFQEFSVHESMIPMIEVLMDDSLMDESSLEKKLGGLSLGKVELKDVIELHVESYYVSTVLVGERGAMLRKIRDDGRAMLTLEEIMEDPGHFMVYIFEVKEEISEALYMVKNLLNEAATRANEMLDICRASYREERL